MKSHKGKVTQELLDKMTEARKNGASYTEIESRFDVSRYVTIHYLKDIKPEKGVAEALWKKAEEKSVGILMENGFIEVVNLNEICPTGYFDILAKKGNERWLIDVTINEAKDLANKSLRIIQGYRCAVLYLSHDLINYRLVELKEIKF